MADRPPARGCSKLPGVRRPRAQVQGDDRAAPWTTLVRTKPEKVVRAPWEEPKPRLKVIQGGAYAFAFIGLKWDAREPFVEHRGCGVLAAVALTRVLGEPSPDDLLVAPPTARVLSGDTIAPEGPAEILVLVAKFRGSADYDPTARVYQALADNLYEVLPEITRVEYVDREVLSRKDAIGLGQRYQASMVVWGSYDNLGVRPRYEVTRDSLAARQSMVQLDEATRHALKEEFDLYVTDDLGKEISFLSLNAVGAMCTLNLNHTAALDAYQKALSLVSRRDRLVALGAANIYRDIAGIQFGLRNHEEALEANERAMELAPDDLLTRVQMVTLRGTVEKKSAMQMIADLRALIHERAKSETDAETKDALETVLRALGAINSPAALKELVERARRRPAYTDTTQNQQYRKDVAVHLQKAVELDARQEFARALREYDQAIRLNQRCAYAIAQRGTSLAVLNRIPEALAELERARRIDPKEVLVYHGFAAIYYERREYEKSLEYAEQARSLPFGKQMALRAWGLSLIALGRGDEVMTALKDEEVPLDSTAFFQIRATYFRVGGNLDAALREINEALRIKNEFDAEILFHERARIYAAQHRYDLALEDARQALATTSPGTYSRRASEIVLRDMAAAAAAYEASAVAMS